MKKVPVQKGPIEANLPKTSKMKTHHEHIEDRMEEQAMLRRGQTCDLKMPKSGKG